jgi:hypothetical protein
MATTINANNTDGVVITPDTSGELELQANGVTKAKVTANGLQDANGNSLRGGSYRNLIINGDMQIAQRGTSATGQSGYIAVDRFRCTGGSDAVDELSLTHAQVTDAPDGFGNSYKITVSTPETTLADEEIIRIEHRMEGQNLQHLKKGTSNAEAMTLSFWIKGSVTGTYIVNLHDSDNGRTIAKSYTINSANTWEYKTITFAGDSTGALDNDNAQSLSVYWYLGAGANWTSGTLGTSWSAFTKANVAVGQTNILTTSGATWQITGVQLEVGEGASDFEFLPYDVQARRCMRYFQSSWDSLSGETTTAQPTAHWIAYSGSVVLGAIHFPEVMRITPTMTLLGASNNTVGQLQTVGNSSVNNTWALVGAGIKGVGQANGSSGTTAGSLYQFQWKADAEL